MALKKNLLNLIKVFFISVQYKHIQCVCVYIFIYTSIYDYVLSKSCFIFNIITTTLNCIEFTC